MKKKLILIVIAVIPSILLTFWGIRFYTIYKQEKNQLTVIKEPRDFFIKACVEEKLFPGYYQTIYKYPEQRNKFRKTVSYLKEIFLWSDRAGRNEARKEILVNYAAEYADSLFIEIRRSQNMGFELGMKAIQAKDDLISMQDEYLMVLEDYNQLLRKSIEVVKANNELRAENEYLYWLIDQGEWQDSLPLEEPYQTYDYIFVKE